MKHACGYGQAKLLFGTDAAEGIHSLLASAGVSSESSGVALVALALNSERLALEAALVAEGRS